MSYGSTVLAEYPTSYGQSIPPSTNQNPYQSDARYPQETTMYSRPSYPQNPSATSSHRSGPPQQPRVSLSGIPEYDQSLPAAAPNAARLMNGSTNRLPNGQPNYHQPPTMTDNNFQSQPNRTSPQMKTQKQSQFKNQQQSATRTHLSKEAVRGAVNGELNDEVASNQSANEKSTKVAWPGQQNKLSRSKPIDNKPLGTRSKPIPNSIGRDKTSENQNDRYFDAVRDNDASPSYDSHRSTSLQQPASTRTQLSTNSSHQPNLTGSFRHPKTSHYEPSSPKHVARNALNNSSRRHEQLDFPVDELEIESFQSDPTDRDSIHKNANERFQEALQKLRADRAKQRKQPSETTAKRLQYGNYIRHSSTDDLLQSAVKPPSKTDFLELKKGNLLSLSKEEKRQLFDQSRSYGERVRYRNYDIWQENEVTKSLQANALEKDALQKSESSKLTPRQRMSNEKSKSFNGTLKQHALDLPTQKVNAIEAKQKDARDVNQMKTSQKSRTKLSTNRSNSNHSLNEEHLSDYASTGKSTQRQQTKKKVRYAKYDSVGREISGFEDDDDDEDLNTPQPRPLRRLKLRQVSSNLYTLEEEKSFENSRHTKR